VRRIGVLMPFDENDPEVSLASLGSLKRLRTWVGPTAATFGLTFVGRVVTAIGCARAQELVGLRPDAH
jgi:hypothetical protein